MSDEVWSSGADPYGEEGIYLGDPSYGDGLSINEAFSVDNVFRIGFGMLSDQPALVILVAFLWFAMQLVVQLVGPILQIPLGAVVASADLPVELAQAFSQLGSIVVSLAMIPVQQLVLAGSIVVFAHFIRNDEVSFGALFTQVTPTLRLLLYFVLIFGAYLPLMSITIGPFLAAGIGLAAADQVSVAVMVGGLGVVVNFFVYLYIGLGLLLVAYPICIDDAGALEAIATSWNAAKGGRVTLFVTTLCLGFAGIAACCMCYLPVFLVQAAGMAGFAGAWLQYARPVEETEQYGFFQRIL